MVMDMSESLKEVIGNRNLCAYAEADLNGNIRGRNMVRYETYDGEKGSKRFGLREAYQRNSTAERLKLEWEREYG